MWWQDLLWGFWNGLTAWVVLILHIFGYWESQPFYDSARSGGWWVQVGAYSAREGAEQVRETLRVADLPARVVSAAVNGKTVHRVRVGPYASATQAESAQARSVLLGYANAAVIAP